MAPWQATQVAIRSLRASGAGVANASCGLPDLGMTTLDDVLTDVRRITRVTKLPLLVDADNPSEASASTLPPMPMQARQRTEAPPPPTPPAPPVSEPIQAPTSTEPTASRRLAWVLAAVVALAGAGFVFKQMSATDAPTTLAGPASAAVPALAASTPLPQTVAQQPATPPASAAIASTSAAAPATSSSAAAAPTAPASAAALAAAAAKKAAAEKERLAKLAQSKVTATNTTPEPARVEPLHAAPAVPAPAPASTSAPESVAAATPRQACEGRVLLGFQSCMTEQCAKPVFAKTSECVERRAMEQRRREAEQSRK